MKADLQVIEAFISHLQENGYPGLRLDERPDERERNVPDIDALAGPLAIEHTSMDTVEGQRRDSATFEHLTTMLEREFAGQLQYRLMVYLPYDEVAQLKGKALADCRAGLRAWIAGGAREIGDRVEWVEAEGVPFRFRASSRRESPSPRLIFSRLSPEKPLDVAGLADTLRKKVAKLARYKTQGRTTILLIESGDLALMNEHRATDMIKAALHGLQELPDQVWFTDTSIAAETLFRDLTELVLQRSCKDGARS